MRWLIGVTALLIGFAALLVYGPYGRRTIAGFAEFIEELEWDGEV